MSPFDSQTPAAEAPVGWIHVLATCTVLGMFAGEDYWLYPTKRVELLIKCGHLLWLDEPDDGYGNLSSN